MLSTLATVLLVPYFGWGIYALRLKYRFHEDLPLVAEACTLLALLLFYALEVSLLSEALNTNRFQFMIASLGLVTSGAALYGPMAISFSSRLIVEAVVPGPDANDRRPRLGPAEALERRKDYEGALQEYYVITRMFPKDHVVPMRIANLHLALGRPAEAVVWLQRAQKWTTTEAQAHTLVLRLLEVLEHHLQQPAAARAALGEFLSAYPDAREGPELRARLVTIGAPAKRPDTIALNALSDAPLLEEEEPKTAAAPRPAWKKSADKPVIALSALDDVPLAAEGFDLHVVEARSGPASGPSFSLEKLDDAASIEVPDDPEPLTGNLLSLEAMDPSEVTPKKKPNRGGASA